MSIWPKSLQIHRSKSIVHITFLHESFNEVFGSLFPFSFLFCLYCSVLPKISFYIQIFYSPLVLEKTRPSTVTLLQMRRVAHEIEILKFWSGWICFWGTITTIWFCADILMNKNLDLFLEEWTQILCYGKKRKKFGFIFQLINVFIKKIWEFCSQAPLLFLK